MGAPSLEQVFGGSQTWPRRPVISAIWNNYIFPTGNIHEITGIIKSNNTSG